MSCEFQWPRFQVGISGIAGWGCFIQETADKVGVKFFLFIFFWLWCGICNCSYIICFKGDLIAEYTGEVISKWESERRGLIYDKFCTSYIFGKCWEKLHSQPAFHRHSQRGLMALLLKSWRVLCWARWGYLQAWTTTSSSMPRGLVTWFDLLIIQTTTPIALQRCVDVPLLSFLGMALQYNQVLGLCCSLRCSLFRSKSSMANTE